MNNQPNETRISHITQLSVYNLPHKRNQVSSEVFLNASSKECLMLFKYQQSELCIGKNIEIPVTFLTHLCRLYCAIELLEINPAAWCSAGHWRDWAFIKKKKLLQWAGPGQDALPSAHKGYFQCRFLQQCALVGRFGKGRARNDGTSMLKVLGGVAPALCSNLRAGSEQKALQCRQFSQGKGAAARTFCRTDAVRYWTFGGSLQMSHRSSRAEHRNAALSVI